MAQEARERTEAVEQRQTIERRQKELELKRLVLNARIAALTKELQGEEAQVAELMEQEKLRLEAISLDRAEMAKLRRADA